MEDQVAGLPEQVLRVRHLQLLHLAPLLARHLELHREHRHVRHRERLCPQEEAPTCLQPERQHPVEQPR